MATSPTPLPSCAPTFALDANEVEDELAQINYCPEVAACVAPWRYTEVATQTESNLQNTLVLSGPEDLVNTVRALACESVLADAAAASALLPAPDDGPLSFEPVLGDAAPVPSVCSDGRASLAAARKRIAGTILAFHDDAHYFLQEAGLDADDWNPQDYFLEFESECQDILAAERRLESVLNGDAEFG